MIGYTFTFGLFTLFDAIIKHKVLFKLQILEIQNLKYILIIYKKYPVRFIRNADSDQINGK